MVNMIGLKRYTVRIVDHNPQWACLFEVESRVIRDACGELVLDVEHVGSTAVPDLPAKPILDIALAVASRVNIPIVAKRLVTAGYIDRGDGSDDGGYLLVKESEPNIRMCHLHIVEIADVQWHNYLAFRNMLRQSQTVRHEYSKLKRQLATRFENDRKSYTQGKHDFIQNILEEGPGGKGAK